MQVGGEAMHLVRAFLVDIHAPLADLQRRFERLHDASALDRGDLHPVLDDLDQRLRARAQLRVALRLQQVLDFLLREVLRDRDGEGDLQPRLDVFQGLKDAVRRVFRDQRPAAPAIQLRRAGEQQLQVIVQLGHRADRRARGAHRVRLVDGDGRRNAVDRVDLRLVHPVEELARVRAEGLDVAALALRVESVEDERGLARARNAGHDHELSGRDCDAQVLQVVLAGAFDDYGVARDLLSFQARYFSVLLGAGPSLFAFHDADVLHEGAALPAMHGPARVELKALAVAAQAEIVRCARGERGRRGGALRRAARLAVTVQLNDGCHQCVLRWQFDSFYAAALQGIALATARREDYISR